MLLPLLIALQGIPTIENKEDVGVVSVLVFLVSVLLAALGYLYRTQQLAIKEKDQQMMEELRAKDERIKQVINDHTNDLKESNNDYKTLLDKYHKFTEQIREIANAKRGG